MTRPTAASTAAAESWLRSRRNLESLVDEALEEPDIVEALADAGHRGVGKTTAIRAVARGLFSDPSSPAADAGGRVRAVPVRGSGLRAAPACRPGQTGAADRVLCDVRASYDLPAAT